MTRQASVSRHAGLVAVPGVAAPAVLVLWLLVQAAKARRLVATSAGGGRSDAARPVRTMATFAANGDLTVRRARFCAVAAGARSASGGSGVGLVALDALRVTRRRALGFRLVTVGALGYLRAAVWLMAARTLSVTRRGRGLVRRASVASLTAC